MKAMEKVKTKLLKVLARPETKIAVVAAVVLASKLIDPTAKGKEVPAD
jgi:hypothetical protein